MKSYTKYLRLPKKPLNLDISFLLLSCEPKYTAEEWQKLQDDSEFNKEKEEIIKFDSEYKIIIENFNKKIELFKQRNKNIKKPINNETLNRLEDEFRSIHRDVVNDLKKLYVPESLDDFYDKNIEYYTRVSNLDDLSSSNELKELEMIKIEIDRIQREVYRKYDLEYLLKK